MKSLFTFTVILSCALFVSCSEDKDEAEKQEKSGDASDKGSAFGFDSPEEALDALGKAMAEGDEAAFRKVAANDEDAIAGLEAVLFFEKDMDPKEAARVNLIAMAEMQGLAKVLSKRFPAEIDGDRATIVHVFEDTGLFSIEDKFRKWQFEKKGGKWNIVGSEFGDAKELPDEYKWDKSIADVSDEMRDFISQFNGTTEAIEAALAKYADGVDADDMDFYSLEQPVVTKKEEVDGTVCYTLNTISGATRRRYLVCWKDSKIVSIKDLSKAEP